MAWTYYRDPNTGHSQATYATPSGQSFTFTRDHQGGRQLNVASPIRFNTKEEWNAAVNRGIGTHATSLVTRARAHLGSYVSLIEQEYGSIDKAPPAQQTKCQNIQEAQKKIHALSADERQVDPADIHNGPLQEQLFKHRVQAILINLRKALVKCDREAGSAMLGRADHIIVHALEQVSKFNWPFAKDSPYTVEKNTRGRKISEQDQLSMPSGGIYFAKHEFPDGLSDMSRNLLMNAVIQHNKSELDNDDFKNGVKALGQTRGPLTNFLLRMPYQLFKRLTFGVNTTETKALNMNETREERVISEAHAQWIAHQIINEPINKPQETDSTKSITLNELHHKINNKMKGLPTHNQDNTKKRVLWNLLQQDKTLLEALTKKSGLNSTQQEQQEAKQQTQKLARDLAPLYPLDDLKKQTLPLILPESTQGNLFARGGIFGATYQIIEPMIAGAENMAKNDPIMGSVALMIWAAGSAYVGGFAAAKGAHMVGAEWFKTLSEGMNKVPGLKEFSHAVYTGVMPLTSEAAPVHVALAQAVDGFIMGHLAYQAMTGKTIIDQDPHSINGKLAHFIITNPIEAAVLGAACYAVGLGTIHALREAKALGSWSIFDYSSEAVKPMIFAADIFFAMHGAITTQHPTFAEASNEKIAVFMAKMFANLDYFESMSPDDKKNLETKAIDALKSAPVGSEYAALLKMLKNQRQDDAWEDNATKALNLWLPGQAIRHNTEQGLTTFPPEFKDLLQKTPAGLEYDTLTTAANGLQDETLKTDLKAKLNELFPKKVEFANALKDDIRSLNDAKTILFNEYFSDDDKQSFTKLLPSSDNDKLLEPLDPNAKFNTFLKHRYPECVTTFGECKNENDKAQWESDLISALQKLYREDLLLARETNPRVWTVLKQYPVLISQLSGATVEAIELTPVVPLPPASWQASLLPSIGRAAHGLLFGATIGLGMYAFSRLFNTPFGEKSRQWSGFNNLRGLMEGVPYFFGMLARPLSTINETLILARARTLDKALALPKNLKSIPGWLASIIGATFFVAVDAAISPLSIVYNLGAKLGSWVGGKKPSQPSWTDIGYKLPLIGFVAEAFREQSFEERAARRLIQNNTDTHIAMGLASSATKGRAGDISMYRKSHVEVKLEVPPADYPIEKTIDTTDLHMIIERYNQSKRFASNASHIMMKSALFLDKITDKKTKKPPSKCDFCTYLQFIFPEETEKLKKEYNLSHIRTFETKEHITGRNQAMLYALEKLFNTEIESSTGSKTHAAFKSQFNSSTTLMIAAFGSPQEKSSAAAAVEYEEVLMADTAEGAETMLPLNPQEEKDIATNTNESP